MRRRIAETRWPDRETVADHSQGVPLEPLRELARHWATDYDWHRAKARLNALPQFMTNIDGLDIHFIHVRSRHADALPLIMTHGWPGIPPRTAPREPAGLRGRGALHLGGRGGRVRVARHRLVGGRLGCRGLIPAPASGTAGTRVMWKDPESVLRFPSS
jgi:hypothetical protein